VELLFYYLKNRQDVFYATYQNFVFYLLVPEYGLHRVVYQFPLIYFVLLLSGPFFFVFQFLEPCLLFLKDLDEDFF